MSRRRGAEDPFAFLTRRQLAAVLKVPQRVVDQWIATGQITPIRLSLGFGRGGQRVYYKTIEAKKLKLASAPRRRARRRG